MFNSYCSGWGMPPRSSWVCAWALIRPGRTYLPVGVDHDIAGRPPRIAARQGHAVERDHIGDHVVLDHDVFGSRARRAAAIDHHGSAHDNRG